MLYANTDDGSSALWVCDGNGIVVDNISIYGAERAPILEQINEHYGTSFTGWSDNEIGLRFGDSLPNWNAYEKIETTIYIKFTNTAICGYISNSIGYIYSNNNVAYIVNRDTGIVEQNSGPTLNEGFKGTIKSWINSAGYNVERVDALQVVYEIGDQIPNWDKYVTI